MSAAEMSAGESKLEVDSVFPRRLSIVLEKVIDSEVNSSDLGQFSVVPGMETALEVHPKKSEDDSRVMDTTDATDEATTELDTKETDGGIAGSTEAAPEDVAARLSVDRYSVFSSRQKVGILVIMMFNTMLLPLTSTLYMPLLTTITTSLNADPSLVTLSIALYNVTMALFPMIWANISDHYGRKWVLVCATVVYIAFTLALCFTADIAQLIGLRIGQAAGISASLGVGGAVIADIFAPSGRGQALGVYQIAILVGPVIGPIIGGGIAQAAGWRSVFYFTSAYGGALLIILIFALPETLPTHSRLQGRPAPWRPLLTLRDYRVVVSTMTVGVGFFTMYLLFTDMSLELGSFWHFPVSTIGLCYIPFGVGTMIGPLLGGRGADKMRARMGTPVGRLVPLLIAMPAFCVPAIIYGFTVQVHWAAILVTTFFTGVIVAVYSPAITSFLIEMHPKSVASVSAMLPLMQYSFAAVSTGIAAKAVAALGPGPLLSIISAISMLFWAAMLWMFLHLRREHNKTVVAAAVDAERVAVVPSGAFAEPVSASPAEQGTGTETPAPSGPATAAPVAPVASTEASAPEAREQSTGRPSLSLDRAPSSPLTPATPARALLAPVSSDSPLSQRDRRLSLMHPVVDEPIGKARDRSVSALRRQYSYDNVRGLTDMPLSSAAESVTSSAAVPEEKVATPPAAAPVIAMSSSDAREHAVAQSTPVTPIRALAAQPSSELSLAARDRRLSLMHPVVDEPMGKARDRSVSALRRQYSYDNVRGLEELHAGSAVESGTSSAAVTLTDIVPAVDAVTVVVPPSSDVREQAVASPSTPATPTRALPAPVSSDSPLSSRDRRLSLMRPVVDEPMGKARDRSVSALRRQYSYDNVRGPEDMHSPPSSPQPTVSQ